MRAIVIPLLAASLASADDGGVKWYDASGKLVKVESEGAARAEEPFVAEWRKREIERRERMEFRFRTPIVPYHRYRSSGDDWGLEWYGGPAIGIRHGYFSPRAYTRCFRPVVRSGGIVIRW